MRQWIKAYGLWVLLGLLILNEGAQWWTFREYRHVRYEAYWAATFTERLLKLHAIKDY